MDMTTISTIMFIPNISFFLELSLIFIIINLFEKKSMTCSIIKLVANFDDLVKNHEVNYRWLSKKVHIQGIVFFQERGHTV